MEPTQYARIAEALRVTELTLCCPHASESIDAWRTFDGHVRVAAAMHRTLGNAAGAIRLMRRFCDASATNSDPEVLKLSDAAASTVWEWEGHRATQHAALLELRSDVLAAELGGDTHAIRSAYMAVANHETASGHFNEAAAALQTVMLLLPADDAGQGALRARVFELEANANSQRALQLPPSKRPVLDDAAFLSARHRGSVFR